MNKEELKKYIYEPMPNETPKAFDAYCVYRNMGKSRTLDKVVLELNKSKTLIARWSTNNNWTERVELYDLAQEKINREIITELNKEDHKTKLLKYRQENENLGKAFRGAGANLLNIVNERISNLTEDEKKALTIKDINGLAKSAEVCTTLGDKLLAESLAVEKLLQKMVNDDEQ
jgi:hypothetical protein